MGEVASWLTAACRNTKQPATSGWPDCQSLHLCGGELILSSPHQRREAAVLMWLGKQLLGCVETEQTLRIPRQKPQWPSAIGPQRKGSAVGKAIGSGLRTGCQETRRGQGGERAASSPQDAAQRFPRKFTEQKMIAGRKNI